MIQISVVLPTYKPGAYIYDIDSIDNQTLGKEMYELIIVLNGCNEPYKTELSDYISNNLSKNLNIVFIQIDQGGVSNARNIGIEQSKGDYITFIDDDDYISSSYLEELLNNAAPNVVSVSNAVAFDDVSKKYDNSYRISKAFRESKTTKINGARKFFSGPYMKLIHKDIVGNRRFDENFKIGEDSLFMFLISDRIKECRFTSQNAIYYRRNREGSAIRAKRTVKEVAFHQWKMIRNYIRIYLKNPTGYSFWFFITRIMAALKVLIIRVVR